MKRLAIVLCLGFLPFISTFAEPGKSPAGTRSDSRRQNGQQQLRTETTPQQNPFPPSEGTLERQRSAPVPNSRRLNSVVRWVSTDAAAIGQDVAASTDHAFVGWNLNNTRVSLHDHFNSVPGWENLSDPNTYRNFVALSADAEIVANASYQNIYLFDKNTGNILLNFVPEGGRIAGPIAVSRDGSVMVCATIAPNAGGVHRLYAFALPSPIPIWTFDFDDSQSTGVYGVNISVDKSTVAVNGKFYGWVLDANTGTVRTQFDIANTESKIALSGDASVMAIADLAGFVSTYQWNPGLNSYDPLWRYRIPAGLFTNWASAIEVSADGLTIMAGTLIFLSAGYDGTVYLFDTFGDGTPNWVYTGAGDEIDEVALSDDGSLASAITWGDIGNTQPDILIFERNSNIPVYTVNTEGSMFSLAMSADGRTVVAGGKAVHARVFGSGGNVYNIEVDLGGGTVSGTVTLTGALNNAGAKVEAVGTNRKAVTDSNGTYHLSNLPTGTYSLKVSSLGYVNTTLASVNVVSGDTTENINATLTQTGAAPTGLVASHGLNAQIQLSWTTPSEMSGESFDRSLAADGIHQGKSISARRSNNRSLIVSNNPLRSDNASTSEIPDSVRIYRGIRSGGPYYFKGTVTGSTTGYVDTTAQPLKDYYYRVTAVYGEGESAYSNEAFGTVDSSFLQFSISTPHRAVTPTIDGILSPGEWTDALQVDVSDVFGYGGGIPLPRGSVFMYMKYDSTAGKLYIAGEDLLNTDGLTNGEGFGLYFDDNNNDRFSDIGGNPLVREGNYWGYYYTTGAVVRFRELYGNGGVSAVIDTVTDAEIGVSTGAGHFVGEVSIPLSFLNKNHLQVFGPDKNVGAGMFVIGRDGSGSPLWHGWWPQTMSSVFTAPSFGNIHIPINLVAPPKAPANVSVTRQGTGLVFTWDDPTHGLNNDPLGATVTLELERNNVTVAQLPLGVQTFTDTGLVDQGWYEYRIRGFIDVVSRTQYHGPYSEPAGEFAVSAPQLTELIHDDGVPEAFYVVDFSYDGNKFAVRYTPSNFPARVYRVKAFTNNGNSPILVSIHADSSGLPGRILAGPYIGESHQQAGVDSFLVTLPADDPPIIAGGDFFVVLGYLPSSPGAPGIGGDFSAPIDGRSMYFTNATGWVSIPNADLVVRAFVTDPSLEVDKENGVPTTFALYQNYPNPFNPSTSFEFQVPNSGFVTLKLYDILGSEVITLVNEQKVPGKYSVKWNAEDLPSGVYFARLSSNRSVQTIKLMLLK